MWKRSYVGPAVLCMLGAILAIGLLQIFRIRLSGGDLYPAWSSLRSEPDGTRVLFESLTGTGRFDMVRKYRPLRESPEHGATVLYLGYTPAALERASDADLEELETAARAGNRIVMTIDPGQWFLPPKQEPEGALRKRWSVSIGRLPQKRDVVALAFDSAEGWTRLKEAGGQAVVIEHSFGSGTIVLAASSDALANESLAGKRDSELIMTLIGANARVVFDESHLGVRDTGSVLGLVHKYRMDGVLWGLLAIALVFVWNHAAGFPPPEQTERHALAGYDSRSGLGQLLRRQIALSRVIESCISEWKKSNARLKLAIPGETDPVAAYRTLQGQLTRK
jgi:hypothetical protein